MLNKAKTKYMLSSSREVQRNQYQTAITTDGYTFEDVKQFTCLGTAITAQNDNSLEIKRWITLPNRCYYGPSRHMCSRALSRQTKLALCKTLILPVLLYGAEAWVLSQSAVAAFGVFAMKILHNMFGPVRIDEGRMNHELYKLYADMDIVKRITVHRLRWL